MKTDKIKQLLEKYYDGTCSAQEKKSLIEYFSGQEVSPGLSDENLIFGQIHSSDEIPVPKGLEAKLNALIDDLDREDSLERETRARKGRRSKPLLWLASTAAAACLLLTIGYISMQPHQEPLHSNAVLKDTYSDPEQAYAAAEKTLMYISSKLDSGFSTLNIIQDEIDRSNKIIDKSLKQLKTK